MTNNPTLLKRIISFELNLRGLLLHYSVLITFNKIRGQIESELVPNQSLTRVDRNQEESIHLSFKMADKVGIYLILLY